MYSNGLNLVKSLYEDNDFVIDLTNETFDTETLNCNTAWVMEFYSSYCGHCVRYASTYKLIANAIKGWSQLIKIGAVNCADPVNSELCRSYTISSYPTVLFLPANSKNKRPTAITSSDNFDIDKFQNSIINFLRNKTLNMIDQILLAPLYPFESSNIIWELVNFEAGQVGFAIYEDTNSYFGSKIILDLLDKRDRIIIGRITNNDQKDIYTNSIYEILSNSTLKITARDFDRNAVIDMLIKQLDTMAKIPLNKVPQSLKLSSIKPVRIEEDYQGVNLTASNYMHVYERDLVSSLYYSLGHEIVLKEYLDEHIFENLKSYVKLLAQFLPVRNEIKRNIANLYDHLIKHNSMFIDNWIGALKKYRLYDVDKVKWEGCLGSSENKRGYPCSLWLTFHSLTVSILHQPDHLALKLMESIRFYVKTFFSCTNCRDHFLIATSKWKQQVIDSRSLILFLWEIHNMVNFRLQKDQTEDPLHPKLYPFPSFVQCPRCYREGWKRRSLYNKKNKSVNFENRFNVGNKFSFNNNNDEIMNTNIYNHKHLKDNYNLMHVLKRKEVFLFIVSMYSFRNVITIDGTEPHTKLNIEMGLKLDYEKKYGLNLDNSNFVIIYVGFAIVIIVFYFSIFRKRWFENKIKLSIL